MGANREEEARARRHFLHMFTSHMSGKAIAAGVGGAEGTWGKAFHRLFTVNSRPGDRGLRATGYGRTVTPSGTC
jgi:hypothetical protein